jgi:integrase
MHLAQLNRSVVTQWHSEQSAQISANRALAHLSKACSFAVQRGWLEANPCVGIERNQEIARDRSFTDEELQRIGAVGRNERREIWDCICVLALTGMRSGEVLNLTTEAFDPARSLLILADSKTGRRPVALLPFAADLCKGINMNFKHRIAASPASFSKTSVRVMHKAVIHGASAHTFRHTLATFMAQHGNSVFQIAAMGGWKTLSMVQRYVNLHGVGTPHPTPADERIAKALGLVPS